jgi:hypothetical protein
MSTGIEALRAPRPTAWPVAVLALLVVMTVAIIATTMSLGVDRTNARFVGRHVVNTPTELSGGVIEGTVSGTAANTPSELRAITVGTRTGAGISFNRHVPRPEIGAGAGRQTEAAAVDSAAEWPRSADAIAAAERYDRHQRR